MFLSKGRLVYLGAASLAEAYFQSLSYHVPANENAADFFIDVVTGSAACAGKDTKPEVSSTDALGCLQDWPPSELRTQRPGLQPRAGAVDELRRVVDAHAAAAAS